MKPLRWVGSALVDLRGFPADARRLGGHSLHLVQLGLEAKDWKPMPGVGPGAYEIRIQTEREHRIFYVAKFEEAVYALHCFEKKTRHTPIRDLEVGRERYRTLLRERRTKAQ
jgi:phage-related protein